MKTRQQELELIAEWLGIEHEGYWATQEALMVPYKNIGDRGWWSPLISDTDFLNMVAGRVDIQWYSADKTVECRIRNHDGWCIAFKSESHADHNNSEYLAMKHAAYQVCLMAAGEGKQC